MREIKFRVWIDNKFYFIDIADGVDEFDSRILQEGEVSQFIGLNDKVGNPIFEGDVVETKYGTYLVKFDEGEFFFDSENKRLPALNYYKTTVYGNIYENPEILTK